MKRHDFNETAKIKRDAQKIEFSTKLHFTVRILHVIFIENKGFMKDYKCRTTK